MNLFIGIGNITKDIELKYTPSGKAVASFTIAINERNDKVEFVNCVAWEKQAENLNAYCGKGSKVAVNGKLQTRTYDAQDGSKRYVTEIVAFSIEFLNTKQDNQQNQGYQQNQYQGQQNQNNYFDSGSDIEISEDDLPF